MSSTIEQKKDKLRNKFLMRRKQVGSDRREEMSRRITAHIVDWEIYLQAKTVHCFISIDKQMEIDTWPLIQKMAEDRKRIVVPRAIVDDTRLEHLLFRPGDPLEENKWGIPEPVQRRRVPVSELDLIFVPAVSIDRKKNRLGYGKGFYDRFLSEASACKAGLLFEDCVSESILPVEEHDEQLDAVVTEKSIF